MTPELKFTKKIVDQKKENCLKYIIKTPFIEIELMDNNLGFGMFSVEVEDKELTL